MKLWLRKYFLKKFTKSVHVLDVKFLLVQSEVI